MTEAFNTIMSLVLALLASVAVLSARVRDGIIIKGGLICIALGFLGAALVSLEQSGAAALATAHALVHVGLLVIAVGYLWRTYRSRRSGTMRRVSDWVDLA